MLYPPVSAGGLTGNANISDQIGVRLPTSPKPLLVFLYFPKFLKTFLLHDPQSKHLLLELFNLVLVLFYLLRCLQELAELTVGDKNGVVWLFSHGARIRSYA